MAYIKVIKSGTLYEEWTYEREPAPKKKPKVRVKRVFRQERREDAMKACRGSFKRLVRANLDPKQPPALLTLTMAEIVEVDVAYRAYTLFTKRLKRIFPGMAAIAVPEFQKRGAVHFHVLLFNVPNEAYRERKTRAIASCWGYGFVDIKRTDGNERLSSYLAKYMSKAMHDRRLIGKRAYSASRNVKRPTSLNTPFQISLANEVWGVGVDNVPERIREYGTLFLGRCVYKRFIVEAT